MKAKFYPKRHLDFTPELAEAQQAGLPLVALESTIIAHGMPYPQNLETARDLEAIIRAEGAVPATLAIIDGRIKIGLNEADLHFLATSSAVEKASRRDLAFLIAQKKHAATTVAATMILAAWAGIEVFATGGIGGVHRGATETMDISADLQELARTPVAVVSSGAKAILDLGLTLEYLETQGVPVIGVKTDEFPAFYTRQSGLPVPARLDSPAALARLIHVQRELGLGGGILIANPIPAAWSMPRETIDRAIDQALAAAETEGVWGKALTPFLLDRIKSITAGKSLVSNIELVKHNAQLAAQVAVELSKV